MEEIETDTALSENSTKKVTLTVKEGRCVLTGTDKDTCHGDDDWVGLYENSSKRNKSYLTWQWVRKGAYTTRYAPKVGMEARYFTYSFGNKYKLLAKSQPLPNAYVEKHFNYKGRDSWIRLGCNVYGFEISWNIPSFSKYDWIGIYRSTCVADKRYEKYVWVDTQESAKRAHHSIYEGYHIRFFHGTSYRKYRKITETETFSFDIKTHSDDVDYLHKPMPPT